MNNNIKKSKDHRGQAMIEYIMIFAFMSLLSVKMVNVLEGYLGNTIGGLGYHLTQQLTSGVSPGGGGFFDGYVNGIGQ